MYRLIRKLLFHFDAESVHEWTAAQMERLGGIPLVLRIVERLCNVIPSVERGDLGGWGSNLRLAEPHPPGSLARRSG